MSWNRQTLMKQGKAAGFTGKSADEFVEWADENGVEFDGLDTEKALRKAFNKTVTIIADAGEEVVVEGAEMTEAEDEILDDEDEVKEADEEEAEVKAFLKFRKQQKSQMRSKQAKGGALGNANVAIHTKAGSTMGNSVDMKKSAYDRAVKHAQKFNGKTPLFYNADRREYFGAKARLTCLGSVDYALKDADIAIIQKGSAGVNSTGGALVFYEELPELIENLETNGAARKAIGVTNMRDGEQTVPKISGDVTMYDVGEGSAITASDPTFGNVKLVATKTAALIKESSELLNDSAFNIGEVLARSINRAVGTWEDEGVLLGQHGRQGIINDILVAGGANVKDTASASWSAITNDQVQDMLGLLPGWALEDPNFGFMCSMGFAQSVFYRFGLDAGGNRGADIAAGAGSVLTYNGFPIYISQVMPKTHSGDQISCLAGAWSHACKFGVVTGSEGMATSDQRYFDEDKVAFRYTQRWAHSLHNVSATASQSGIVGLQD